MITYSQFQPTGFDRKGICLPDQQSWLVAPVGNNRDSDCLTRANWQSFLREISESDTVQIHRFGHWACGWFEIIIIDPNDTISVKKAEDLERALEDYPVLDDQLLSTLEWEEATSLWEQLNIKDRYYYFKKYNCSGSIFQIRRSDLPNNSCGDFINCLIS